MRIRKEPGFSQETKTTVPEGTPFTILNGPVCVESSLWKIRTDDGIEGWMAEEKDGVYLLEPLP